jgi:hypothetical protein
MMRLVMFFGILLLSAFGSHDLSPLSSGVSAQQERSRNNTPKVADVAKVLPSCDPLPYKPVQPDKIKEIVAGRRQFQLVIGASEFEKEPELKRPFVADTARVVSAKLSELGYKPLPSLEKTTKYLAGKSATKERVWAAILEMSRMATGTDVGVIYYVGHGSVAYSGRDLALSVYNRPVKPDEGIRVSDVVSVLSLQRYPTAATEIPKFILVLETCYSGNVIGGSTSQPEDKNGLKVLAEVNTGMAPQPPRQMVMLSATAEGDTPRAFDLRGTGMSAFGYFFVRALGVDWSCADTTPDGILTVAELHDYIDTRLDLVYKQQFIESPMKPLMRDEQQFSFLAYDETKVSLLPGQRDAVMKIFFRVPAGQIATLTLPDGSTQSCSVTCTAFVSAKHQGDVLISTRRDDTPEFIGFGVGFPLPPPIEVTDEKERRIRLPFSELLRTKGATVEGVTIQVQ